MNLPSADRTRDYSLCIFSLLLSEFFLHLAIQAGAAQIQTVKVQSSLTDSFSRDTSLNTSVWTTQSDLLKRVAAAGEGGNQCFSLGNTFVRPILNFGPNGMQMSGTKGWQQFTGIQSLRTFSPPLTLTTTVTATVANGNAFEIFLISSDWGQWFSLYGNVSPANKPYQGIKLGCELFYERTAVGVPYTINISVNTNGLFSVSLSSGSTILATKTLQVGAGPFYLILGQGEGWPNTGGTRNVALWRSVTVTGAYLPSAPPSPSSEAKLWVTQVQPSSDTTTAGQITLQWNAPSASGCNLNVSPGVQNLASNTNVPVACTGPGALWVGSLPPNLSSPSGPAPSPIPYRFTLTGTGISAQNPPLVLVYTLPNVGYGVGGEAFSSVILIPAQGPCGMSFPQLSCWWPFGYSDTGCSSASKCPSHDAKSEGNASVGVFQFGVLGVGVIQDSLAVVYGSSFSLPQGYSEHLVVKATVAYKGLGVCFAALGADGMDFQVVVADNVSHTESDPPSPPVTSCSGLETPIAELVNGVLGIEQFLQQYPQLASDMNDLQAAYTSQDVSKEIEDLTKVLNDLGVISAAGAGFALVPYSKCFDVSWYPTVSWPGTYSLTISPTIGWADIGAGLIGGQWLKTTSSATMAGIAVPSDGSSSSTNR